MANSALPVLAAQTTPHTADLLYIVDTTDLTQSPQGTSKSITWGNFFNSPTLVTPTLGIASATSINKLTITAPATSAVLTVANSKTLTVSNTLTLAGTDSTTLTFQGTDTYVGRSTTDTLTNKTLTNALITQQSTTPGAPASGNSLLYTADGTVDAKDQPIIETSTGYKHYVELDNHMARQAIINGGFNVSQRNGLLFSSANPANLTYLIDRWKVGVTNTGTLPTTITHSHQTHTPGDIWGAYYFYRIAPNGAGSGFGVSDNYLIQQIMENGTRFLAGASKKVTVSFWAKTSIAGTVKLGIGMAQNYGTGGSPTTEEALTGTTVTLTSSWARYTVTFTTNTLAAKTFGTNNDDSLKLFLFEMWGSTIGSTYLGGAGAQTFVGSGNLDISQVQVCAGEVALPYYPRDPQTELGLCQRYFYDPLYLVLGEGANPIVCPGYSTSATNFFGHIELPVYMRIGPAIVLSAASSFAIGYGGAVTLTNLIINNTTFSKKHLILTATVASGLTAGVNNFLYQLTAGTGQVAFNSEL